jgi:ubiquinone/menaquinone biosynthesis C-methylase UbiE
MRIIARAMWGADLTLLYNSMDAISQTSAGATILDVPCGGGVALRALRPEQDVRYIAGDLLEEMLTRAARRAESRGLNQVEFKLADMRALPFADGMADLFLSYSGLHMIHDPASAVSEIGRCLKPGGEVVGTTFVREGSRRQRLLFSLGRPTGHPVPPRAEDLRQWLDAAGIHDPVIEPPQGFVVFRGVKRS